MLVYLNSSNINCTYFRMLVQYKLFRTAECLLFINIFCVLTVRDKNSMVT